MSHRLVERLQQKAVSPLHSCRLFCISRSGYYAARARARRPTEATHEELLLKAAFNDSAQCYGSRRLQQALRHKGLKIGRHRVRTLMNRHGLRPRCKRRFVHTTDSHHDLPIAQNVLARRFRPDGANQAWVSDITYIRTQSGWLYLAAVMDLYSRKIIGWAMAPNMPAQLVCSALQMAIAQRAPRAGLLVHSDRGSQYASAAHRTVLARHGLIASMSRKGNCWDNAVMERFFLSLKMERVWQRDYANPAQAMTDVTDYIVNFYNDSRLHSTLGYLPPNAYERIQAEIRAKEVSDIS